MHQRAPKPRKTSSPAKPEALSFGSLRDYWLLLVRRRRLVAIVFVVVSSIVGVGALAMPPSFTAHTTIMIKHGREFFYHAPSGDTAGDALYSLAEMVNSVVEVLNSRDVAEGVVDLMQVERLYPDLVEDPELTPEDAREIAIGRFRDSIVVMDVLESSIIRITFEHGDRRVAADALNILVDKFKDKHLEIFSDSKRGFISEQLVEYETRLSVSEDELESFRQEFGVYNIAEQKSLLLNQRMALDTELNTTDFRITELEQRLMFLNGKTSAEATTEPPYMTEDRATMVARRGDLSTQLQLAEVRLAELRQQLVTFRDRAADDEDFVSPVPGLESAGSIDGAFVKLLELQLQEKELLRNYNESSRQVLSIRKHIKLVEDFLRDRGAHLEEIIEATMLDELESLVARRASVLDQVRLLDASIQSFDVRQTLDELAPLQARADHIRQEMNAINEEILALDRYEKHYRKLDRAVLLNERNYQVFVDTYEQARIMEELDRQKMVNVVVIETASPPLGPSSLSKKLRILLGMFVGLFVALASAVFLELVRPG